MSTQEPITLEDKIERQQQIRELVSDFNNLAAEFESISEERKAITSRIKSLGLSKKAFQHAVALNNMDAGKRDAYCNSIAELSAVLGLNLQLNLDLQGGGEAKAGPDDDDTGTEEDEEGDPLGRVDDAA